MLTIRRTFFFLLSSLFLIPLASISYGTPEYAEQTGFECKKCHREATGGELTKCGIEFREELKTKGLYRPLHPIQKMVRLIIGYLHLLMAIAWFGTIFYVHILLKPSYAAKGLPRGELMLAWSGIIILSVTGVFLTLSRIPSWNALFHTRFGILLTIKVFLFMIMVSTAAIVTFVIGPRLKKGSSQISLKKKTKLTLEDLRYFDGKENRPAYIAYRGKIYDVSSSSLWKDGSHARKHLAGNDLTEFLKTAPHEDGKILQMPRVGDLVPSEKKAEKPIHEKVFYFMAYMNLIFVFLITLVIALWRWW